MHAGVHPVRLPAGGRDASRPPNVSCTASIGPQSTTTPNNPNPPNRTAAE